MATARESERLLLRAKLQGEEKSGYFWGSSKERKKREAKVKERLLRRGLRRSRKGVGLRLVVD